MAQQERAIKTRRTVLEAAAKVFAEHGYAAATVADILKTAGVTKGALYFHFDSKEALAKGVLEIQTEQPPPPQDIKLQEMVDLTMTVARRLVHDPVLRAGARLSADPTGRKHYGSALPLWVNLLTAILTEAHQRGETLPHVEPRPVAEMLVSAFHGVQLYAHQEADNNDIEERAATLLQYLLPSIATPTTLIRLHIAPTPSGLGTVPTEVAHGAGDDGRVPTAVVSIESR
ncbi:ScbR family autoregulator-binding transcription factor [Streptomyces shenzhenensis]|nr:ScbR family autoregulator-binding transcription factor [Streptomyces shenzhenensis]